MSQYGLRPDEWQRGVIDGWLGTREDGRWSSPRCGLAVSRQNGKNVCLEVREMYGMLMLGERFLHTAHEVKTAQKAFRRLLEFFDNPRQFPKLAARVTRLSRGKGEEAIVLDNGGSFELVSRSRGSGRGFSVDVLIIDEAQELSADALAALLPTISAAANPQTIYTGTPPGPRAQGEIFTRIRQGGLEGNDPRLCWHEWGCDEVLDLDERAFWAQSNPALGIRLDVDTIQDERDTMDDETFGRERLGIWARLDVQRVISVQSWAACANPRIVDDGGEVCFAIDVAPDRRAASITAAAISADGYPFVDVIDARECEPEWVIAKVAALCERHQVRAVVIDAVSPAQSLVDPLRQRGVTVTVTNARQMAAASAGFFDAVMGARMRHLDQRELNRALSVARKRMIGDAGWGWCRKDSESDITPLTTATLALWGLTSSEVAEVPRPRTGVAVFV